jgi:hypothetical protein
MCRVTVNNQVSDISGFPFMYRTATAVIYGAPNVNITFSPQSPSTLVPRIVTLAVGTVASSTLCLPRQFFSAAEVRRDLCEHYNKCDYYASQAAMFS